MLVEKDKAPDFLLRGIDVFGNEKDFSLKDFLGQKVIVYFYPKDNTPGCTKESCEFRDNFNVLQGQTQVIGISRDDIASHKKFQMEHNLNFILLSDPSHKVMENYGAWGNKTSFGVTNTGVIRSTFLIDAAGLIVKVWYKVKVEGHVARVLSYL